MSTSNTSLRITELDCLSIERNLKNFLRSQSEFTDFDFDGSGMSVLISLLAYNTHYMGYYLNMVGSESFLDTAQLRPSIISHAKLANYVPGSKTGAQAEADIIVTPSTSENQNTAIVTLEKYTKFLGQDIDGVNYPFIALYSNTVAKSSGSFTFNNIILKQGEIVTLQYLMEPTNTSRRFTIPSANVDMSTISVTVQESSSNTYTTNYTLADDITEVKSNSAVYFVEENYDQKYTLYFGDNVIGLKPKDNSIIIVNYLDVAGTPANNISRFYHSDPIGGLFTDNVTVTSANSSYGGTNKETIEQVRFRAPYFYTTQNRAVSTNDYETLITKDYNNIDSVSVWGGEDNDPVVYGKVYMSMKTKGSYKLTNVEKESIKKSLIETRNILTVTPEIVDPDYTYLLLKGTVMYNPTKTRLTATEILQYVKASISDYNTDELNTFKSTFRKSKLQNYIENSELSITGSDISVYIQKRVILDTTKNKSYVIPFNIPLQKGNYNARFFTTPEVQMNDYNGISRDVYFEEVPFSETGIDTITILDGGQNYSSIPTITITGDGSGATATAVVKNGRVIQIQVDTKGTNYTQATVTITGDGTGASAIVRLEAKTGTLRSYYYKTNGEKIIINDIAGDISYDTGEVNIYTFRTVSGTPTNRYYNTDELTFNFPIDKEIISPLRNRILAIDENDPLAIQIDMVSET